MAVESGFFNSIDGDRKYNAEHLSNYFEGLISDGIFANVSNALQVVSNGGMQVIIKSGRAWVKSKWFKNDSEELFAIDPAHVVLDRIDRVVLRLNENNSERTISLQIKKGIPSGTPMPPDLVRDGLIWELNLATVQIGKNTQEITQSSIIDTRMNTEECGWVTGLIEQVDTTELFLQWEQTYKEQYGIFKEDWDEWFDSIQDILNENAAGNLQLQIDAHASRKIDSENGAHNIRYAEDRLQHLSNEGWKDITGGKQTTTLIIGNTAKGHTAVDFICTGTDDHIVINTAINAMPEGGKIIFLEGTYNIGGWVDINKRINISGMGSSTILKRVYNETRTDGENGAMLRILFEGCAITNICFDGNRSLYVAENNRSLRIQDCKHVIVSDNIFKNSEDSAGIVVEHCADIEINNNIFTNNDSGLSIQYSSSITVSSNILNYNVYGIAMGAITDCIVSNNSCANNQIGISMYNSSSLTISSNTVNNNSVEGISLNNISKSAIAGNTCNDNKEGIVINTSKNNSITGNTVIRRDGLVGDYTSVQNTINIKSGTYNLIALNSIMGKNLVNGGGTTNTLVNNKYN